MIDEKEVEGCPDDFDPSAVDAVIIDAYQEGDGDDV